MTEAQKIQALVRYRMEQSDEALRSARTNQEHGLERSAVNRAYYAMFYAVLALLATRAEETSKHSGAISRFDRDFIKPGKLPKEFSRWLHDAFTQRQGADYASEFVLTTEDVKELVENAATFAVGVSAYLRSNAYLPDG
jgi:uncharacterized protein (UPF0332 family)